MSSRRGGEPLSQIIQGALHPFHQPRHLGALRRVGRLRRVADPGLRRADSPLHCESGAQAARASIGLRFG